MHSRDQSRRRHSCSLFTPHEAICSAGAAAVASAGVVVESRLKVARNWITAEEAEIKELANLAMFGLASDNRMEQQQQQRRHLASRWRRNETRKVTHANMETDEPADTARKSARS